ncbi:MAG: DUF2332 domain-containing protein [Nitriliruptorales bacterium]|nr:DUF2332 domain-containing protein [Nitriliruptorales bacterium]
MDGAGAAEILRDLLRYVKGRSRLYERLIAGVAGATERGFDGGVIPRLLTAPAAAAPEEVRLLILAALHRAALDDPDLAHAAWYPTARGDAARHPDDGAPAALALAWLIENEEQANAFVTTHRLQTNEAGRCAALLTGFLAAASFGKPLRLLELGASAGLNLRFDRYRYEFSDGPSWGPAVGPLLESRAEGAVPRSLSPPTVEVTERRGVDLQPIDPLTDEGARLLRAFVWPDEPARHERLTAAIRVAHGTPATIEQGDLVSWALDNAGPEDGVTTVLFHSQVRHFLTAGAITQLGDIAERCLRAATPDAPFAYVSFEPPRGVPADGSNWPEVSVGLSDGSGPPQWRTIASSDWHGTWVRWF